MSDEYVMFRLTEEHLRLLRRANVRWEDCEFGAPAIDCKRPYGNNYALGDIAEILGVDIQFDRDGDIDERGLEDRLRQIHHGTEQALAILCHTGQSALGVYRRKRYGGQWERVVESVVPDVACQFCGGRYRPARFGAPTVYTSASDGDSGALRSYSVQSDGELVHRCERGVEVFSA